MLDHVLEQLLRIRIRMEKLLRMKIGLNRRTIELGVVALLTLLVVALPFIYGTKTYPVAIVEGNSMYPDLQNGDMVLFHSVNPQTITNGSIIVYVTSDTGISLLDTLTKPIIIHRVVGSFVQADGARYFLTKGDNNNFTDPSAIRADHVLGRPLQVIPKFGYVLLFIGSPQGLVATIGFITLFYLSYYEAKLNAEKTKETFLGTLAHMVLKGAIPEEAFRKFEIAVKYVNDVNFEDLKDGLTRALVDWLEKGAAEKGWGVTETECPNCHNLVRSFKISRDVLFVVCPRCIWEKKQDLVSEQKVPAAAE